MLDASGRGEEFLGRLHSRVSTGDDPGEDGVLTFSDVLGRRVRSGEAKAQKVSTLDLIEQALEARHFEKAAELADFFKDEAEVVHLIYRDWLPKLIDFFRARGVDDDELTAINERILGLIKTPDGRPFHARRLWAEFEGDVRNFILACGRGDADDARTGLATVHAHWVTLHDHDVDHIYGLMDAIVRKWGEAAMADVWEHMIGGLFSSRYAKFDTSQYSWEESLPTNIYLAIEAMRGHLVGPGRRGNVELEEDEHRYTLRFDPCGSGGHIVRGDQEVELTPSRMEPPYEWAVLQEEHDFGWNKKGVCLYCTNCCVVMQLKPIDTFGYPVRVVEPPTYPDRKDAKCTWHIYKDPRLVPERYYEDVGRTKPAHLRSERDGN
jgi:hypothetical protein